MIRIRGGRFWMGDDEGEYPNWGDPTPAHEVELGSFYLGQYLVTQSLWQRYMGNNPARFKGAERPVEQVSWEDTQEFLSLINEDLKLEGERSYRLPTEAEWEFAARGGVYGKKSLYAGGAKIENVSWFSGNSQSQSQVVGLKAPNELGLYDMTGNVDEWCSDWFQKKYYQECFDKGVVINPQGPHTGLWEAPCYSWGCLGLFGSAYCRVAVRDLRLPSFSLSTSIWVFVLPGRSCRGGLTF